MPSKRNPEPLRCPKCGSGMEPQTVARAADESLEVDRCVHCGGLWFDLRETDHLRNAPQSRGIDSGDPKLGRQYDKVDRIPCPRCGGQMIQMVDLDEPAVGYEGCTICHGLFLDAGEFRQLTDPGLLERLKRLWR